MTSFSVELPDLISISLENVLCMPGFEVCLLPNKSVHVNTYIMLRTIGSGRLYVCE